MKLIALAAFATIFCLPCFWLCEGKHWRSMQMLVDQEELSSASSHDKNDVGTRWAVLVAGSRGYENYRHQADVCHAYQILKKGGLKDENIIVFMYDDIADSERNPRPGIIINHPKGHDVYAGVPKDYTGQNANAENLYAVLLGNKSGVKGGSGKVVASNSKDRIFLYYTDHGGPGVLDMPIGNRVYAKDLLEVIKKKHELKAYKEMVIYVEACESGSMFEGLLTEDLDMYVTTASNAKESSWSAYCRSKQLTCLGDLYSVAWMEDSERHNLKEETIGQQYERVKKRTSVDWTYRHGSHVMDYGNKSIKNEKLYLHQGDHSASYDSHPNRSALDVEMGIVDQRDVEIFFLWNMYNRESNSPEKKLEIQKKISETIKHRSHIDASIESIGKLIFGPTIGPSVLSSERGQGMPLVDDWDCLKSMVAVFEKQCGPLTQYGLKYTRAFANICNKGISLSAVEEAFVTACGSHTGQ